jgi:hypothetical protein
MRPAERFRSAFRLPCSRIVHGFSFDAGQKGTKDQ